jgi:hypothetical protein
LGEVMMNLTLTLEFACGNCEQPVGVTVQCRGEGPCFDEEEAVVAVDVPCPNCKQVNQVTFEPSGRVRSVRSHICYRSLLKPCRN